MQTLRRYWQRLHTDWRATLAVMLAGLAVGVAGTQLPEGWRWWVSGPAVVAFAYSAAVLRHYGAGFANAWTTRLSRRSSPIDRLAAAERRHRAPPPK